MLGKRNKKESHPRRMPFLEKRKKKKREEEKAAKRSANRSIAISLAVLLLIGCGGLLLGNSEEKEKVKETPVETIDTAKKTEKKEKTPEANKQDQNKENNQEDNNTTEEKDSGSIESSLPETPPTTFSLSDVPPLLEIHT